MPTSLSNLTGTAVNGQTNLAQPTVNADDGSWGTSLNNNWKLVDQVFKDDGTGDGVGLKIGSTQTLDATSGTTKVATPSGTTDATTKAYVDAKVPLLVAANLTQVGPASGSDAAPTFRALVEADIPGLSGEKITSGTVAAARVDSLNASKITAGTLDDARIPSLNASKITAGTVADDRLPSNAHGTRTLSTADPTGGSEGDIWYKYDA